MSGHFCDSTAFGADKFMKNDRPFPPKKKKKPLYILPKQYDGQGK